MIAIKQDYSEITLGVVYSGNACFVVWEYIFCWVKRPRSL